MTTQKFGFEVTHPGEMSAGMDGYTESITVIVENDPGGDDGDFAQHMQDCLADWFSGARVTIVSTCQNLESENDRLRSALVELRDRIIDHPAYEDMTEDEEIAVGGDSAELSYLARVANEALNK